MTKQELNITVEPENATDKELTCTLSDKSLATLTVTDTGLALEGKQSGTGTLTITSAKGEVTKTLPVSVGETNCVGLGANGEGVGNRFVQDLPYKENCILNSGNFKENGFRIQKSPNYWGIQESWTPTVLPNGNLQVTVPAKTAQHLRFEFNQVYTTTPETVIGVSLRVKASKPMPLSWRLSYQTTGLLTPSAINVGTTMETYNFTLTAPSNEAVQDVNSFFLTTTAFSSYYGETLEIEWVKAVLGSESDGIWQPCPEDYSIIHGQPNLLSNTSETWVKVTYSLGYDYKLFDKVALADCGLAVGDYVSLRVELDATESSGELRSFITFYNESGTRIQSTDTNKIAVGAVGVATVTTTVPEGATHISASYVSKDTNSVETTASYRQHKLIKGKLTAMDSYAKSQQDFEGYPNLLDGTTENWKDFSFTGEYNTVTQLLLDTDFKVGDSFSLISIIDNRSNAHILSAVLASVTADGTVKNVVTNNTNEGTMDISYVTTTIASDVVKLLVYPVYSRDPAQTSVGKVKKTKLIKGGVSKLGIWLPKERATWDTTQGVVPFTETDYTTMLDPEQITRSETLLVDRGADMTFVFPIIATMETYLPEQFADLTMAEKITKFKSLVKTATFVHTDRGGGLRRGSSSTATYYFSRGYCMRGKNQTYLAGRNLTSELATIRDTLVKSDINAITDKGLWTFIIGTGNNQNRTQTGSCSDGVTPCWLEVKDVYLEIITQLPENPNAESVTIKILPK